MTFVEQIRQYPQKKQLDVWKKLAPFLSVQELKKVMARVQNGEDLFKIHRDMRLLEKYQVEVAKILATM